MSSESIRYVKKVITRIILTPLKLMRTKRNRVLLINDMSSNYSDNLKYVGEELLKRASNFDLIYAGCSLKQKDLLIKKGIQPVELNSIRYFMYGMTSRVLITNSGGISYLPLKRNQYVINTWHGGGAYKKMGIDMYEDTTIFRKDMALASKETDVLLTTCERFKQVYCKAMLESPDKFWNIGMPRNDCLKNIDIEVRKKIRKEIGLNSDERLVLFAPTYRKIEDNYFKDSIAISYGIDEKWICNTLKERFGGTWVFGYRYHPCVINKDKFSEKENVIDLTDYDDMQELLIAADVLINDFSSSMWDYMLTRKPCFIFAKDLDHYIETTELYTPISEWPFSIAKTNEQLVNNILAFKRDEYEKSCDRHYKLLGGCESGNATNLVCNKIEEWTKTLSVK